MRDTFGDNDRLYHDSGSGYIALNICQNSLNCALTLMKLIVFRLYLSKANPKNKGCNCREKDLETY